MDHQGRGNSTTFGGNVPWLALVFTFLPGLLFAFLFALNPHYMARIWRHTCGWLSFSVVLVLMGLTYLALSMLPGLLRQVEMPKWLAHLGTAQVLLVVVVAMVFVMPAILLVLFTPAILLLVEANVL